MAYLFIIEVMDSMEPRSSRRRKQHQKKFPFLLVFLMLGALVVGFFLSPLLMEAIDLNFSEKAFPWWEQIKASTQQTSPWKEIWQFILPNHSQEPAEANEPKPNSESTIPEPKPSIVNEPYKAHFSVFTWWRLQLAFSTDIEWIEQESQDYRAEGLEIWSDRVSNGAILFIGPYRSSDVAEDFLEFAEQNGFDDAYPIEWNWVSQHTEPISAEHDFYAFAKAVSSFDALASKLYSESQDAISIQTELQAIINTKYDFAIEEQKKLWQEATESLQKWSDEMSRDSIMNVELPRHLYILRHYFHQLLVNDE